MSPDTGNKHILWPPPGRLMGKAIERGTKYEDMLGRAHLQEHLQALLAQPLH